ncbi:putative multiple-sugar transport system permease YteP [Eisenbergiella tayi]|uniref:Putative multiple-sugar transport system permease YteP n=1 Tax=Eisenbergiella tayi TaxID=1432052 RepID=A0A1E3ARW5_9FIRM|nr:ABC transporter permease subunit [Eisenbergiella tayi]ODM11458.1 putative multiple-sugar transport system permease YteP [Eisenbergiella tayi]
MGTKVRKTHLTKGKITLLCMTIPSVLFILVFSYFPISGWIYSFFDYRIGYKLSKCEFVGLDNFIYAFGDPYIITVILNTLIISILGLLGLPLAGMIAILLSEVRGKKFKKTVQTAITIPNFISWIIIYSIMFSLFSNDGLLTTLVRGLSGNRDSTVTLLTNPGTAKLFMVLTNIWKTVGYNSIIFFAAVTGIDSQLYDAAAVDGAGRWQKILHITIPGILPTFITLLVISVGAILNNGFEQYYVFVNPMIQKNIEVLDYYVYRIGMLNNDIPASTAVSMIKTFISVVLVFGVNKLSKKTLGQSIL